MPEPLDEFANLGDADPAEGWDGGVSAVVLLLGVVGGCASFALVDPALGIAAAVVVLPALILAALRVCRESTARWSARFLLSAFCGSLARVLAIIGLGFASFAGHCFWPLHLKRQGFAPTACTLALSAALMVSAGWTLYLACVLWRGGLRPGPAREAKSSESETIAARVGAALARLGSFYWLVLHGVVVSSFLAFLCFWGFLMLVELTQSWRGEVPGDQIRAMLICLTGTGLGGLAIFWMTRPPTRRSP